MKKYIVDVASLGIGRLGEELKNGKLDIIGVTVSPDADNYDDLAAAVLNEVRKTSDIPVYKGAKRPLLDDRYVKYKKYPVTRAEYAFRDGNRVNFLIESAKTEDDLEIVCLGALSNLALAIMKDEEAMKKVGMIYVAGGAMLGYHTTTPTSHHNILADREAARTVFDSGIPITLVPAHISDDAAKAAFAVAEGARQETLDAYLSIDVGIGFSRGQTVIDTVGRNPINGVTVTGRKQTVVTALK